MSQIFHVLRFWLFLIPVIGYRLKSPFNLHSANPIHIFLIILIYLFVFCFVLAHTQQHPGVNPSSEFSSSYFAVRNTSRNGFIMFMFIIALTLFQNFVCLLCLSFLLLSTAMSNPLTWSRLHCLKNRFQIKYISLSLLLPSDMIINSSLTSIMPPLPCHDSSFIQLPTWFFCLFCFLDHT